MHNYRTNTTEAQVVEVEPGADVEYVITRGGSRAQQVPERFR